MFILVKLLKVKEKSYLSINLSKLNNNYVHIGLLGNPKAKVMTSLGDLPLFSLYKSKKKHAVLFICNHFAAETLAGKSPIDAVFSIPKMLQYSMQCLENQILTLFSKH